MDVIEVIQEVFDYLIANYALYLVVVMGALMTFIYIVLNLIKKPVKKLTNKIKNDQIRHLANKIFILLSFGLSTLLWYLLNKFIPQYFAFNGVEILITGSLPVVLYALVDGLSKPKAKAILDTIKEVVEDEKTKESQTSKLKPANKETVEQQLEDLLNE